MHNFWTGGKHKMICKEKKQVKYKFKNTVKEYLEVF